MFSRTFTKTVLLSKLDKELRGLISAKYEGMEYEESTSLVKIILTEDLTLQEDTDLTTLINNHVPTPTLHQSIMSYLKGDVNSFIENLLDEESATNMTLGITAYGKTAEVLGLFTKKYDYENTGKPVSLSESLQHKSLYETIKIIEYIRLNPSEFSGLSPFITDTRLLELKNKVESFLGVPLTT